MSEVNTSPLSEDEKQQLEKLMNGRRYIVVSAGPTPEKAYANTNSTTEFLEELLALSLRAVMKSKHHTF